MARDGTGHHGLVLGKEPRCGKGLAGAAAGSGLGAPHQEPGERLIDASRGVVVLAAGSHAGESCSKMFGELISPVAGDRKPGAALGPSGSARSCCPRRRVWLELSPRWAEVIRTDYVASYCGMLSGATRWSGWA
jgi:hypothetical protein